MATKDEALAALLDAVKKAAEDDNDRQALRWAEAYAWLSDPSQPHGGSNAQMG